MPSRIDDEWVAVDLLKSQIATITASQPRHRVMAALSVLLTEQIEIALKKLPLDPHPNIIDLFSALRKFADSLVSRGGRAA